MRHRWIGEGHRVDQAKVAQVHVVPSAGLAFDAINEGLFKVGRRVAWLTRGGWTRNKMEINLKQKESKNISLVVPAIQ